MTTTTTPVVTPLTGKKGQKIVPTIHPKYDDLVPVDSVLDNPEQSTVYSDISRENTTNIIDEFAKSIKETGLEQIPIVTEFACGTRVFKSGMTRRKAFKRLGATHIPINIVPSKLTFNEYLNPKHFVHRVKDVLGSNLFDKERQHVINLFKQVDAARIKFKEENGYEMPDDIREELCKLNGLEEKFWNMAKDLQTRWPEKYNDVCAMKKNLVPAHKELIQRDKQAQTNMPANKAGDNLLNNSSIIREVLSIASNLMGQMAQLKLRVRKNEIEFLDTIQTNIKSGLLHEAIVKAMKHVLEAETGDEWDAPTDNKYDLECEKVSLVVDVKTRIEGGKSWICAANNIKAGYYLFCETNDDLSRWFVGYGYTKGEEWSKKQTVGVYTNEMLESSKTVKVLIGQLKKGKVYLDSLI